MYDIVPQIKSILMTTDTVGGVWTYCLELAAELSRRGIAITLATMGAPLNPQQRLAAEAIPNLQIAESSYKLEWMQDPWDDVDAAGQWLLELAVAAQPDVVHLNGYTHGSLPWEAPVLMVGHSCVLSWWRAVKGEDAPAEWYRYRESVGSGLQRAQVVVTPTQAMLDALQVHYGPFRSTAVIPNCRALDLFKPLVTEPFIFTAGRLWDEAKNIAALEAAAPQVSWPIFIAGEEKHPAGGALCAKNVQCLGKLATEEIADWLGRASIYALPARYEPFGLSILEAALSGCALVLGDIPSLREIWGEAAVYVPPDNIAKLRQKLQMLIEDEHRRVAFAAKARKRALKYSPKRTADAYVALYNQLIKDFRRTATVKG